MIEEFCTVYKTFVVLIITLSNALIRFLYIKYTLFLRKMELEIEFNSCWHEQNSQIGTKKWEESVCDVMFCQIYNQLTGNTLFIENNLIYNSHKLINLLFNVFIIYNNKMYPHKCLFYFVLFFVQQLLVV